METVSFDLPDNRVQVWAAPKEFLEEGKKIAIVSFTRLSKDKGETTAKFLDNEGKTYRLTFLDISNENKKRHLEVHSRNFKDDLATSVRKEFGSDIIPRGAVCLLRVEKVTRETKQGTREMNHWILTKVEGADPVTDSTIEYEPPTDAGEPLDPDL